MAEIRIKIYLPDGTESGEMTMPIENVLTMGRIAFFAKLCRESDEKAGTNAIETIKNEIVSQIVECKDEKGEFRSTYAKEKAEKLEKKLLIVCPELKQAERKLKTVAKNQLYFWIVQDREKTVKISAHLGDKYQLPCGIYVFIEKEQCRSLKEKPKYRASEESTGMMIKKGSLKEVKEFLKLESTEEALKNALESWRAKENAELIKNAKSGKIGKNEIVILTNDENEKTMIEMHLADMYTNAKQAETAETEPMKGKCTMKENETVQAVQETTPETVPTVVVETTEETAHGAKWAIMQLLGIDQPETVPTITCTNGGAKITMTAGAAN